MRDSTKTGTREIPPGSDPRGDTECEPSPVCDRPRNDSRRRQGQRPLPRHADADEAGRQPDDLTDQAQGDEEHRERDADDHRHPPHTPTIQRPARQREDARSDQRADEVARGHLGAGHPELTDQRIGEHRQPGRLTRRTHHRQHAASSNHGDPRQPAKTALGHHPYGRSGDRVCGRGRANRQIDFGGVRGRRDRTLTFTQTREPYRDGKVGTIRCQKN